MSRAKKPLSTTRPPQSEVSRRNEPCSDEIRSIRADMQLLLQINKRWKALETTRPRTASVTPTLNLVLIRARDTVRTLTTRLQNSTGENSEIRMYALRIFYSLASDVSLPIYAGFLPLSFRQQAAWKGQLVSQKETRNTNHCHWTLLCGSSSACFRSYEPLSRRSRPFCIPSIGSLWSSLLRSSYTFKSHTLTLSMTYVCVVPSSNLVERSFHPQRCLSLGRSPVTGGKSHNPFLP
jgi:hypothetical protein